MTREIKFRAWDDEEKMIRKSWTRIAPEETRGLVLMQYTGLKDKNGKEIYEGDILEIEKIDGKVRGTAGMGTAYSDYWAGVLEIIGNIYENPELLK